MVLTAAAWLVCIPKPGSPEPLQLLPPALAAAERGWQPASPPGFKLASCLPLLDSLKSQGLGPVPLVSQSK